MFQADCTKDTGAGDWMRKYCQKTCGICKKKGNKNGRTGMSYVRRVISKIQRVFYDMW